MKKRLKYTLVSLGSLVVLTGIGLGIMYMVSVFCPYPTIMVIFLQFCISKKTNVCLKESLSNELRNGD